MPRFDWRPLVLLPPFLAAMASIALAEITDSSTQAPSSYDTFVPPALGASYVDPVFATNIKRLSDSMNMTDNAGSGGLTSVSTEYSTASPFNSNASRLILQHQSYFGLYDGSGSYLGDLPFAVNASAEPRWSRTDPDLLYFVSGNRLVRLDVATGATAVVRQFGEYSQISGRGESDISRDGDHFVFAGDNRYVFVYQISTDTKGPTLDTGGQSFNNLYIAPDNSVAIGWLPTGTARFTGVELFDRDMTFQRQLTHAIGHMRLTRDTNGDDLLVWNNSNDPSPLENCQNGIVKVRLSDARQTCLLQLDWSLAVHITAADGNGWAIVETYAPGDPFPQSADWATYANEIVRVRLDGSQTSRLLHHRSRPLNSYSYQPRATVSRDGSKLVFTSNFNLQSIFGYPVEYSDVYLVAVPAVSAPSPDALPTPVPVPAPPPPVTPAPAATEWIQQDSPAVNATGSWSPNGQAVHSGGSAVLAMDAGSTVTLTFSGTGVSWVGYRDEWSGIANVYLDGVSKGSVDTYSPGSEAQATLYSVTNLANASHTLAIQVTGTRNPASAGSWVWVDAFGVAH